jgi:S-adenosylmethionine:tRNA ribosyltransferase-isomerase
MHPTDTLSRGDFSYALPDHLIAQRPLPCRANSRLMVLADDGPPAHKHFRDVLELLNPNDLLVLNDTRVVPARLFAEKDSGGRAELLLERVESERVALCQVRVSKALKPGRTLRVAGQDVRVVERVGSMYRLEFSEPVLAVLERHGEIPLPPYIERPAEPADAERYQTVYARQPGAVAAPTAGLHFDDALLAQTAAAGIQTARLTLHVGAGTFQPVRVEDVSHHRMHRERVIISAETVAAVARAHAAGGRVVAVGTTVVRALEAAPSSAAGRLEPMHGETDIFIYPGYRFRVVDALITNFHLPESSLLMLVAAFAGRERILGAYRSAVAEEYRFFSYGDAMFISRRDEP